MIQSLSKRGSSTISNGKYGLKTNYMYYILLYHILEHSLDTILFKTCFYYSTNGMHFCAQATLGLFTTKQKDVYTQKYWNSIWEEFAHSGCSLLFWYHIKKGRKQHDQRLFASPTSRVSTTKVGIDWKTKLHLWKISRTISDWRQSTNQSQTPQQLILL